MRVNLKIQKLGNKLGLYFPSEIWSAFKENKYVEITFIKQKIKITSISKLNRIIAIKKEVESILDLKYGERIEVILKNIQISKKTDKLFKKNKIDLLSLIPERTKKSFSIIISEFNKNGESWLRLNCFHKRGSCSQIELRRFIDIDILGRLLGQIQSEGTKNNFSRVEFSNKSPFEHIDFITYLSCLGIPKDKIFADCDYHLNVKDIERHIKNFEKIVGIKISYKKGSNKSLGGFSFHTFVRSVLFSEIILNSLENLKNELIKENWDKNLRKFADCFFAKVLSGDGNIELITKNRKKMQARVKISDGNVNCLGYYKKFMEKYGFISYISMKQKFVRSYINKDLAEKLYSIGAFHNNPNEKRLILFINLSKNTSITK